MSMKVGVQKLHYALNTKDDATGVTYSASVALEKVGSVDIKPNSSTATYYADDGAAETATGLGDVTVTVDLKDLPLEAQAALLGHTLGTDGIMIKKATDVAPYIALGFYGTKANGEKRYKWLLKGKASIPEDNYKSKSDKVELQSQKIEFKFIKRDYDDAWDKTADSEATGFLPQTGTDWFDVTKTLNLPTTP